MEAIQDYKLTNLYKIRHSLSHIMAQAVLEKFPDGKIAIGPPIENGFYYDFELPRTLIPEDLIWIEKRMREIIKGSFQFNKKVVTGNEARNLFQDQPFKIELINGLEKGGVDEYGEPIAAKTDISIYTHDGFTDLCAGPHVANTNEINPEAFKLLQISGAYWRGDEKNQMLQRISGTAWETAGDLQRYLAQLEEAKRRDHRKLGKELEIFIFDDEVGPGLPLWLPNGGVIIDELEDLARQVENKAGYARVRTPHVTKEDLFIRSGHLPYYAESMFPPMEMEGVRYYVKPMNCPMHHKLFASKSRSYRDLPLRLAEYGACYRYEKSGELFGLMRVRSMQMNDAHIYCSESQFEQEFLAVVGLYQQYFDIFGIDKYVMRLSTHHKNGLGKKYVDNERLWLKTEDMVRKALHNGGVPHVEVPDQAAFYGPKIDVQIWSAIGREFTLATNQVDFAVPGRFDLKFVNEKGEFETPLCIHRAPLSTHERFIGFLIEHYAGSFPVWLAPEQVRLLPVTDAQNEYAFELKERLFKTNIRASVDTDSERINAKIRNAQLFKVPYMFIVGEREKTSETVSLRKRDGTRLDGLQIENVISAIKQKIASRSSEI